MSWNKTEVSKVEKPSNRTKLGRWLASTGIIIALLAGATAYFLYYAPKHAVMANGQTKNAGKIEEAEADLTRDEMESESAKPPRKRQFWEVDASETNNFSEAQMRKWTAKHLPPSGYTNNTSLTEAPPEFAIFNTAAENEIACLLTLEPGEAIVDIPTYSDQFKREFYEGLKTPIQFNDEDSEYQRELKEMMIEARIEMKRQIDAGADLGEILTEAREELQDLARYKSMLSFQLGEIENDTNMSDQDLEDFVKAANEMLEAKGIAPIELGYIAKMRLKRLAEGKGKEDAR